MDTVQVPSCFKYVPTTLSRCLLHAAQQFWFQRRVFFERNRVCDQPQTTANKIVIMRPPLPKLHKAATYKVGGVRNPDGLRTMCARLNLPEDGNLAFPSYQRHRLRH